MPKSKVLKPLEMEYNAWTPRYPPDSNTNEIADSTPLSHLGFTEEDVLLMEQLRPYEGSSVRREFTKSEVQEESETERLNRMRKYLYTSVVLNLIFLLAHASVLFLKEY